MGLTYQMKMKIPFDMADMNGHIKLPDVILLSPAKYQVCSRLNWELATRTYWSVTIWSGLLQTMRLMWFACLALLKRLRLKQKR